MAAYNYSWLAPGYHQQVVCQHTECPLTKPEYFDRLIGIAERVIQNAAWIRRRNVCLVVPEVGSHLPHRSMPSPLFERDDTSYIGLDMTDYRLRNRYVMLESTPSLQSATLLPSITRGRSFIRRGPGLQPTTARLIHDTPAGGASGTVVNDLEAEVAIYRRLAQDFKHISSTDEPSPSKRNRATNTSEKRVFEGRDELILWCLLNGHDLVELKRELDANKRIIPSCVLSSLLFCSLRSHFADGVRLLLEAGASPTAAIANSGNALESLPISVGFYHWRVPIGTAECQKEAEKQMSDCIKALVLHGADLLAKEKFTEAIPLHFLAFLAVRSQEAAKAVVKLTDSKSLNNLAIIQRWKRIIVGPVTSLECAFVDVCSPNYEGDDDRMIYVAEEYHRRLEGMLSGAILPLLQAGGCLSRDPFEDHLGRAHLRLMAGFVATSSFAAKFLKFLIAARGKTSFNVDKFSQNISRVQDPSIDGMVINEHNRIHHISFVHAREDATVFERVVMAQFPLKLQHLIRINILRRLPLGHDARLSAIEQLCLPPVLASFLSFDD